MKNFLIGFYNKTRLSFLIIIFFNTVLYSCISDDTLFEKVVYSLLSVFCYVIIIEIFTNHVTSYIETSISGIEYIFKDSTDEGVKRIRDYTYEKLYNISKRSADAFAFSILFIDLTSIVKYKSFIVISTAGIILSILLGKLYDD